MIQRYYKSFYDRISSMSWSVGMSKAKRIDYIENASRLHVGIFIFYFLSSQDNHKKVITIGKSDIFLDCKVKNVAS